ncbi:unnamed protein product [Amoebophrya sp. A25]|nr:unnamed protein product [Amoebophrya sp. A25]|eukprot:GSA25T00004045001.1
MPFQNTTTTPKAEVFPARVDLSSLYIQLQIHPQLQCCAYSELHVAAPILKDKRNELKQTLPTTPPDHFLSYLLFPVRPSCLQHFFDSFVSGVSQMPLPTSARAGN